MTKQDHIKRSVILARTEWFKGNAKEYTSDLPDAFPGQPGNLVSLSPYPVFVGASGISIFMGLSIEPLRGEEPLLFVVIYCNPIDFPGKYVVRDQYVIGSRIEYAIEPRAIVDSLNEARSRVPSGMVCLTRSPEDDPVIVESWI